MNATPTSNASNSSSLLDNKIPTATVLIVDDDADTRELFRYVMERQGRRVIEAIDGNAAMTIVMQTRPDLILMDAGLPGLDGISATLKIRQIPHLSDVPVVFISGHVQPHMRQQALAIGGTDYLEKPVSIDALETVVSQCLEKLNPALHQEITH